MFWITWCTPVFFCQSIKLVIIPFVSENRSRYRVFHKICAFWTLNNSVIKFFLIQNYAVFLHQEKWTFDVNDIFSLNFKSLLWLLMILAHFFKMKRWIWIFQEFVSTRLVETVWQNLYREFDVEEYSNLFENFCFPKYYGSIYAAISKLNLAWILTFFTWRNELI